MTALKLLASRFRLPLVLFVLLALAPLPVSAQDLPLPAPGATNTVFLPTVQRVPAFNPAACTCTESLAARNGQPVPNQYIVTMAEGEARAAGGFEATASIAAAAVEAYGGELLYLYDEGFDGFAAVLPAAAVDALAADPRVAAVEPDRYIVLTPPTPEGVTQVLTAGSARPLPAADPMLPKTDLLLPRAESLSPEFTAAATGAVDWGLDRIDQRARPLDGGFGAVGSGAGVHIYIMDTGIRASHQEFGRRVGVGATFVDDPYGANDCNGHGTHVAATAAGATFGVARYATVHPVRVLDNCGHGNTAGVLAGINWINRNVQRPAVVNMSLGGPPDAAIDAAVRASIRRNITYVVAAGNEGVPACAFSPARIPEAITVGASNVNDYASDFSNFGTCVDLYAPGEHIASAWNTSDQVARYLDGTSMASPHVAGAAALFLGRFPAATPLQVAAALRSAATIGRLSIYGTGSPNRLLYVGGAAQPVSACSEVLRNGNFERQGSNWRQASARGFRLICSEETCGASIKPRSGSFMGWLGGGDGEESILSQEIQLPAGKNALVTFWYRSDSTDLCGYDWASAAVEEGGTAREGYAFWLCARTRVRSWQQVQVNLADLAGKRVKLVFAASTDSSYPSHFWVDDVAVVSGDGCMIAAAAAAPDPAPDPAPDAAGAAPEPVAPRSAP